MGVRQLVALTDRSQFTRRDEDLIGTSTEVRCRGFGSIDLDCDKPAIAHVCFGPGDLGCETHYRMANDAPAFGHGAEFGSVAARDAAGVWHRVGQNWDLDADGLPRSGASSDPDIDQCFRPGWTRTRPPDLPSRDNFGPQGDAVAAILARARALSWIDAERVASAWDHGGRSYDIGELCTPRRHVFEAAVAQAARSSGRLAQVRHAWRAAWAAPPRDPSGNGERLRRMNPWADETNLYRVAAQAAGYAAATLAVGDVVDPDVLGIVLKPWQILERGYPSGYFGPRTNALQGILDAIPGLTVYQCDRLVATWVKPDRRRLPRVLPGRNPWPRYRIRRPSLRPDVERTIDPKVSAERHLFEALGSARRRSRTLPERQAQITYDRWAMEALMAAAAAVSVGDLLDPEVATSLEEA